MKNLIGKIRKPENLKRIAIVLGIIIIVGIYMFFQKSRDRIQIDDSLISAPVISISPATGGRLLSFAAIEGHTVRAGDKLAVVGSETLRAQTDGLIISANNQMGGNVAPGVALIQMIKTQDMRIAGTLDENKGLNNIHVGQVVSFTVDALPGKTFWGYVDEIAPTAKQTQAAFSISSERPTQQFQVYARFDSDQYPQIKNGMSAKMTVYTKTQ